MEDSSAPASASAFIASIKRLNLETLKRPARQPHPSRYLPTLHIAQPVESSALFASDSERLTGRLPSQAYRHGPQGHARPNSAQLKLKALKTDRLATRHAIRTQHEARIARTY